METLEKRYYKTAFPAQQICHWLTQGQDGSSHPHDDAELLSRREFSFILKGDIYCRFKSFGSWRELQDALIQEEPEKVDAGAIWKEKSMKKSAGAPDNAPVEREFVIDIDMTDYDDVRTCCTGATLCINCWQFMSVALKSLNIALREGFGFQKIMFVYSGRRGIHCWVSDYQARCLNELKRKQLIKFLVKRREMVTPFAQIFEEVVHPVFESFIVQNQNVFANIANRERAVKILRSKNPPSVMPDLASGADWWARTSEKLSQTDLLKIEFDFLFPKIDVKVSEDPGHLLKLPFSIHPKTQRICVPIIPDEVDQFDPNNVPVLDNVIAEPGLLDPYIAILENFNQELGEERTNLRREVMLAKRMEESRGTNFQSNEA